MSAIWKGISPVWQPCVAQPMIGRPGSCPVTLDPVRADERRIPVPVVTFARSGGGVVESMWDGGICGAGGSWQQ
jgi:hypothetical protein